MQDRCPEATVTLGHVLLKSIWGFARARGMQQHVAFAGIVPFGVDRYGTPHVLLAREQFGSEAGRWSCFAGRPERADDALLATAAREGHEESSGLLGTPEELERLLSAHAQRVTAPSGVHFVFPIQYSAFLPRMFQGVQAAIRAARGLAAPASYHPTLEKNAIEWVALDTLETSSGGGSFPLRRGFAADVPALVRCVRDLVAAAAR